MSNTGNGNGSIHGSSTSSAQEKGNRNKRKFLSEFSVDAQIDGSSSSLTEFPRYELLQEKFMSTLSKSMEARTPDQAKGKEVKDSESGDWADPIVSELEELLKNSLYANFCSAIKKVAECGYTEEVAEWVILRSGPFYGNGDKDALSNIVDAALAFLRRERERDVSRPLFDELDNLVGFTVLEMVNVLREVKPLLSVAEAMWTLLIFDLNLSLACLMDGDSSSSLSGGEGVQGESSSGSTLTRIGSAAQHNETTLSSTTKPSAPKSANPNPQSSQTDSGLPNPNAPLVCEESSTEKERQATIQTTTVDEKDGVGRKGGSGNSKRDMLRQKTFHFEKSYKGRTAKGAFKAKVSGWGGLVVDKKVKSPPDSSSAVSTKNSPALPLKETVSALAAANSTKPAKPMDQEKPNATPKPKTNTTAPAKTIEDYCAGMPYDQKTGKYIPQDEKDEAILAGVYRLQALKKETGSWGDWVTQKVIQTTQRLGKDQAELKMLRQEKEETEKFKKEKQILEESTTKRLSEMDYALSSANGQIEMANSTVHRLELENSVLKKEMEAAKQRSLREATKLEEAIIREQETLKKTQSIGLEKALLQDELAALKGKAAEKQQGVEKAKGVLNQIEARVQDEQREKAKLLGQANAIRRERERLLDLAKEEEERIERNAKTDMQKCNDEIKRMQADISKLKLETESSQIAALRGGIKWYPIPKATRRLAVFRDNFGARGIKQDRECVMCLTEAKSVLFLPCAHQVLCEKCCEIHEKQGMKDCPSCRTLIRERHYPRFRKK